MASPKFKDCKIGLTKIKTLAPPMPVCISIEKSKNIEVFFILNKFCTFRFIIALDLPGIL